MQSNNVGYRNNKKRKGQLTLGGDEAFDSMSHCAVCKARRWGREVHRAHHKLCWNNRRTKGVASKTTLESLAEEERLMIFDQLLS